MLLRHVLAYWRSDIKMMYTGARIIVQPAYKFNSWLIPIYVTYSVNCSVNSSKWKSPPIRSIFGLQNRETIKRAPLYLIWKV